MNPSSKAENKRVKRWQRMTQLAQKSKPASKPFAGVKLAKPVELEPLPDSQSDALVFETKAIEPNEALRNWDNDGGTVKVDPRRPRS